MTRTKFEGYCMSSVVEPILQNLDLSINNVRSVASSDFRNIGPKELIWDLIQILKKI